MATMNIDVDALVDDFKDNGYEAKFIIDPVLYGLVENSTKSYAMFWIYSLENIKAKFFCEKANHSSDILDAGDSTLSDVMVTYCKERF